MTNDPSSSSPKHDNKESKNVLPVNGDEKNPIVLNKMMTPRAASRNSTFSAASNGRKRRRINEDDEPSTCKIMTIIAGAICQDSTDVDANTLCGEICLKNIKLGVQVGEKIDQKIAEIRVDLRRGLAGLPRDLVEMLRAKRRKEGLGM